MEPTTTSIGGSIACSPRAITVLAVPRFPDMAIPPTPGSIAPSKRAVFIESCKTTGTCKIHPSRVKSKPKLICICIFSREIVEMLTVKYFKDKDDTI